ncbi:MAG: Gfo/Idh/MocA family oxidoreductase [Fusobacterium sp.]|uniref:Gfo/Idh/MocA family protein n=1 Tax=Fusobacterium sp. TaxID=68766 RepID=UPI002A75E2E5|nr:Gfo/Idh/MocA family oxidoreductase [Fusobacterium sp.]MDY3060802.1 Gfo/Idh/MocA family oxidoreductase [Fusobacterium sp.]
MSYNWVSLGCGVIANQLAQSMEKQGRTLYGVVNRTYSKAIEFAEKYNIPNVYRNIDEVLHDENVDIIYISTPHNTHIKYLKEALKARKHILCEKSITLNIKELEEAKQLAIENNVILAEAMTIFHMPLYKKLNEIIKTKKLGNLKIIQMNFGSYKEYDMKNRFFNPDLAGGALLDIGVYALSFVRWFMSEKPNQVLSQVKYAPSGVDEQVGILLMNPSNEMATITLSLHAKQPKRGMIAFDNGYIEIYEYPRGEKAVITYTNNNQQETIQCGKTEDALLYEIIDMEMAISGQKNEMYLDYTTDVMSIMSDIRKEWGLFYPEEKNKE